MLKNISTFIKFYWILLDFIRFQQIFTKNNLQYTKYMFSVFQRTNRFASL